MALQTRERDRGKDILATTVIFVMIQMPRIFDPRHLMLLDMTIHQDIHVGYGDVQMHNVCLNGDHKGTIGYSHPVLCKHAV